MHTLKGFFLGRIEFLLDEKPITHLISQKAKALLCYLIMVPNQPQNRDKLAGMLWESSSKESARYNLRFTLWSLRKSLDTTAKQQKYFLTPEKNICQFNEQSNFWLDISEFYNLAEKAKTPGLPLEEKIQFLSEASSLYAGEFLEGFYIKASTVFDDWIFFQREKAQRTYFEVQKSLAKSFLAKKDYQNAIYALKKLLAVDPLQETIYYGLIKLYYISGDRAGAIREYNNCCRVLREELNIKPMNKIIELHEDILKEEKLNNSKHNMPAVSTINKKGALNPSIYNVLETILHNKINYINMIFYTAKRYDATVDKTIDFLNEYKNQDLIILKTPVLPGAKVEFEGLCEILTLIFEKCPNILKQIPAWCLAELSKILPEIKTTLPQQEYTFSNPDLEKIRIFNAAIKAVELLANKKLVILISPELHMLDRTTLEFFSYLFRYHYNGLGMLMIGINDINEDMKNINYLSKIFKNENRVYFISD